MEQFTSIDKVIKIATREEPILRNLQITLSYHALSLKVANRIGGSANWCTFAVWASKQAGLTIRKEDIARTLEDFLANSLPFSQAIADLKNAAPKKRGIANKEGLGKLVLNALNIPAIMARSSDAISRGNQKVYAEIGKEFARFIANCFEDTSFNKNTINRFNETLPEGEPLFGQTYLKKAFFHYYQALFETNANAKAEWMLLANLEIGFHEQIRLQNDIEDALNSSIEDPLEIKRQILTTLFPNNTWLSEIGSIFSSITGKPTRLDKTITKLVEIVRQQIRHFLTENMMVIRFPNVKPLKLGDDIKGDFSPLLKQLNNPELIALLSKIDLTPNSLKDSGVKDWTNFPERMHFIADLFRRFQDYEYLLLAPFEVGQIEAILNDKIPMGKL